MSHYPKGTWIKYRHRGMACKGIVLDVRPDNVHVVGTHERDPEPLTIHPDDIIGRMTNE